MPDERFKGAYEAAMEDAELARLKVVETQKFANAMAAKYGVETPYPSVEDPSTITAAKGGIRADQFANFTYPSEAARAFLVWRGPEKGAAALELIFEALDLGGFSWGSSKNDPKGGLRIALGKDATVRRLANGSYGLWEWYPKAKRDREQERPRKKSDEIVEIASEETNADVTPSVDPDAQK
jgi:hypothetical protein